MNYFVTAIDTDSGKTVTSAILCEALGADYWKPIQAGMPRDADVVRNLVSNQSITFYPEHYLLKTPASPHAAAQIDGIKIDLNAFTPPATPRDLVIEGAGGCLVPINENDFVIDLILALKTEVILVADLYLGSINHTLLTIESLQRRDIPIKGIIFNGEANSSSEQIILKHSKLNCLLRIKKESCIDKEMIRRYAHQLKKNWK